MDRLEIVSASLKAESYSDMGLTMDRFAEFVSHTCHIPRSDLVLGNSRAKLSY